MGTKIYADVAQLVAGNSLKLCSVSVRIRLSVPKFICPVTLIGSADSLKRSWLSVRIRHGVPVNGDVAQMVEQRIENPCVTGSIPVFATKCLYFS
jgi:hypothetical protein